MSTRGDHDIHKRASDGDDQLLPRLVGHALKAGHAADGQQRDVRRGNAEDARGQCVTEFVQQHACKERDNEQHARDSSSRAADLIIGEIQSTPGTAGR